MSGHHATEDVVDAHKRDVAGEHQPDGDRCGVALDFRQAFEPGLHRVCLQRVAPGLGRMAHFGRGEPAIGMLGGGHRGVQRRPCLGRGVPQCIEPALAEGGEHGAGAVEVDGRVCETMFMGRFCGCKDGRNILRG